MYRELLTQASASLGVDFCTTAPMHAGTIGFARRGYADIPCVVVRVYHRRQDTPSVVPTVRQMVYRELAEYGLDPEAVSITPIVTTPSRRTKFVDTNTRSKSLGMVKMGHASVFSFEVNRAKARQFEAVLPKKYL